MAISPTAVYARENWISVSFAGKISFTNKKYILPKFHNALITSMRVFRVLYITVCLLLCLVIMNETRTRIAVGDIVVEKSKEGGSFYKCDDFIHLSAIEWKTLFSLNIIVEGEPKSFILDQDK